MDRETRKASRLRAPRADTLRNRERLIEAARAVFAAGGPEASLEAVARRAGLGIATLYRHFPTREALFRAVYRREVDALVALAYGLAGAAAPEADVEGGVEAEPEAALRRWLRAGVAMVATKKGMIEALSPAADPAADPALYAESSARLAGAAGTLLERGAAAGRLRGDLPPEDLMRALAGLCQTRDGPGWQETVIRLLDVFVDGLVLPAGTGADPGTADKTGGGA